MRTLGKIVREFVQASMRARYSSEREFKLSTRIKTGMEGSGTFVLIRAPLSVGT